MENQLSKSIDLFSNYSEADILKLECGGNRESPPAKIAEFPGGFWEITRLDVWPVLDGGDVKAYVQVTVNHSFVLTGIKLVQGVMGYSLHYPPYVAHKIYKWAKGSALGFRYRLEKEVLQAYMFQLIDRLRVA